MSAEDDELTAEEIVSVRSNPKEWFQGFGRFRNEETRQPTRGKANVLQRRVFEHYQRCQERDEPCRVVVVKYRRAGSSTCGSCLTYMHALNYKARLGVIGTDYKASSNMLEMVSFFAEHDDYPAWGGHSWQKSGSITIPWEEWDSNAPLSERIDRTIATKIEFAHDSLIELYTAKNPESARSAGLNAYHATEIGRWQNGGIQDAGETLVAMRNTLPKKGFHFALEESTADGAAGAFYDTCRSARWPDNAPWVEQFRAQWPLQKVEFGSELQFVLIFAAWFEDERHLPSQPLTAEQVDRIRSSLDADEKELIQRYQQDGPRGPRLGGEVDATFWEQLAWRRGIIATVCTKGGADEFKQEYPSNPLEAFRSSGSPALDANGLTLLEKHCGAPWYGQLSAQNSGRVSFTETEANQSTVWLWERPIVGCRYIVTCDPMSGAEMVTGSGEKDRHAVFVIRDGYSEKPPSTRTFRPKVVARIRPPCQWEDEVLTPQVYYLAKFFGGEDDNGCCIVVEGNMGSAILKALNAMNANLYMREELDHISQLTTKRLGWWTNEITRRVLIATLQRFVRGEMKDGYQQPLFELSCAHALGEMRTMIIDPKGKAKASGKNHDDDPLSLGMGLECLPFATPCRGANVKISNLPPDAGKWKVGD